MESSPPISESTSNNHSRGKLKPKLSPDRISQHFYVPYNTDNLNYADLEWEPCDTRFVLWYHLTTNLQADSIAIAYNVTFPDHPMDMTAEDAAGIVDMLEARFPLFKDDLTPHGHWQQPKDNGWAPCDHGMYCSTLAALDRKVSVMRNPQIRTRNDRGLAEMATALWQGTWQELLTCPRVHNNNDAGSMTRLSRSSKENHGTAFSEAGEGLTSSGWQQLPAPSAKPTSSRSKAPSPAGIWVDPSCRGSRSPGKKSVLSSERTRAPGKNALPSLEEAGSAGIRVDSSARDLQSSVKEPAASSAKWRAAAQRVLPSIEKSTSTGKSSFASAKSHLSGTRSAASTRRRRSPIASERPDGPGTDLDEPDRMPESRFAQWFVFVGEMDGVRFLLQQTLINVVWISALDPFCRLVMHNLKGFTRDSSIITPAQILSLICTLTGANHFIGSSLMMMRRAVFCRWGIQILPPDLPDLSRAAYVFHWTLALFLAFNICVAGGLLNRALELMHELAMHVGLVEVYPACESN
ncbi:hypothetical protein A1O3_02450 [Capronia epimyces CBS 606.96]|uniref:Uncharacterized protein n=1 Tax=Capronia epimyces CBS 606.96 TaxID=1182542 RepID=W9YA71_9EURO|nr:uncharacterized protein A1O3_02450 [Capronia epimyces CBS 606.96]EXJ89383.1 hypothetical protein A1O3_02450 [Capronia epimyces CBS 606.96]